MKITTSRRGSALLIVLGMLAFMIVSAVAFSAYMRYSRLPSSYLRRTSASRQLVKAALARAIDEVDRAIANNPHPGIGTETISGSNKNLWKNRIYFGTNNFLQASETIPVLTLEGLAYLPPALINEARYYSRLSQAARWKPFSFDAGRYAFCAVDVSDYFDVNRMIADRARSSADNARISLAYVFENPTHTSPGSEATQWDKWLEKYRKPDDETLGFTYDSLVPLVSMADFNLALGANGGIGQFKSPFYEYLSSGASQGFDTFKGDADADRVARMTFTTDSWFPMSTEDEDELSNEDNNNQEILDLNGTGQPFDLQFLSIGGVKAQGGTPVSIGRIRDQPGKTAGRIRFADYLPILSLVSLYDYLDVNNVPVTLAAPTCERTPMFCGLEPNQDSVKITVREPEGKDAAKLFKDVECKQPVDPVSDTSPQTRQVYQCVTYRLNSQDVVSGLKGCKSLVTYPFARPSGTTPETFKIDGRLLFFFTAEGAEMKLRTKRMPSSGDSSSDTTEVLHIRNKTFMQEIPGLDASTGVITLPFTASPSFGNQAIVQEEEAIQEVALDLTQSAKAAAAKTIGEAPFVTITYEWTQELKETANGTKEYVFVNGQPAYEKEFIKTAHCGIPPLTADGQTDPRFSNDAQFAALIKGNTPPRIKLNLAIQARIYNSNDKTVDLVPAGLVDDYIFNNVKNIGQGGNFESEWPRLGSDYPVMRFDTKASIELSITGLESEEAKQGKMLDVTPKAVMVPDPRFNHAPESWYVPETASLTKQNWLDTNLSAERSGDIFMEVSNQGYLQSMYELAFLPRYVNLAEYRAYGDTVLGRHYGNPQDGRSTFASGAGSAQNAGMMWRTYELFGTGRDHFEGLGITSTGRGYKVNPYTDSTNVMMAAFANTPLNWALASTNDAIAETGLGVDMTAAEFNREYAWNEYSSGGKFKWEDLTGVAGSFMAAIRGSQGEVKYDTMPQEVTLTRNWKDAWDMLWESDDENSLMGFELSSQTRDALWSTDRKFLYGYWRDCFAARQQLFLIFVRAEPLMMGGGAMSTIPPQLGARAVALVWRDPTATTAAPAGGDSTNTGYPHRTRVLFYKPLE